MTRLILTRVLATIPVIAVVALVVFLLLRLSPGDPAAVIAGDLATPEHVAHIRGRLGLDQPLHVQLGLWLTQLLQGDLGSSIFSGLPVSTLIAQRLEPTLMLTLATLLLSVALAIPLGALAAWCVGSWFDRAVMVLAVLGFSAPVFVLGYALVYAFALGPPGLPVQGYRSPANGLGEFARHLVLPTLTLSATFAALIARTTRAAMLEALSADYIRTARARGLSEFRVLFVHALRNAAVPVLTVIGLGVALLVGGVVVTESVFNIPGVGRLVVEAILKRDYPIIQGLILFFSLVYIVLNLLIDIAYAFLDPRIRY